jgi:hypothetical protein
MQAQQGSRMRTVAFVALTTLALVAALSLPACGGKKAPAPSAPVTSGDGLQATPDGAQAVSSLVMDPTAPQILYAGTHKGLFKTIDGARSWRQLPTPGGGDYIVYLDYGTPSTVYARYVATDTVQPFRLLRSDDGGSTWADLSDAGASRPEDVHGRLRAKPDLLEDGRDRDRRGHRVRAYRHERHTHR